MLRPSTLLHILLGMILLALAVSCNLFHPDRIAAGPFFVVERELVGTFQGRRLVFNIYHTPVATARVHRRCAGDFASQRIDCTDTIHYVAGVDREPDETVHFSIDYRYDTDETVLIDYRQTGVPPDPLRIFRGGEGKGAAIQVYGDTFIPHSRVGATLDLILIREQTGTSGDVQGLPRHYFEMRKYSYAGIPFGFEETLWERTDRGELP